MGRTKHAGRKAKQKKNEERKKDNKDGQEKGGDAAGVSYGGDGRANYEPIVMENKKFEQYYQAQNIVPPEEWDAFMEALREPLPVVFRVTGFKSQAESLLDLIKSKYFTELADVEIDGIRREPPECLNWYPGGLAWQINAPRSAIRKFPALKKLHEFLISETECGNISRQEAVSMIPPLFMDVKPHHKILDMCAAPGSKTAQLIELLHQDENINIPDGFVIANDADNKRCYLMVHQVKRLQSPCFMIINHDAQQLPNFYIKSQKPPRPLFYDRILCDVPCSGDGTLRKNKDVWFKWRASNGAQLHKLQKGILKRGLELLKEGGRLVYSTCSFSPMENEAVVGAILDMCGDSVELVDGSSTLKGLKTIPGLSTWTIMDNDGTVYDKFEDVPGNMRKCYLRTTFPPPDTSNMHLERCIRILPHHQNTGGFFIAVLNKKKNLPWQKKIEEYAEPVLPVNPKDEGKTEGANAGVDAKNGEGGSADAKPVEKIGEGGNADAKPVETNGESGSSDAKSGEKSGEDGSADAKPGKNTEEDGSVDANPGDKRPGGPIEDRPWKKKKRKGHTEDPFIWFKEDEPLWPPVKEFFGVSDNFPMEQCLVRCDTGKKRQVYFASEAIKALHVQNEKDAKVKVVNLGIVVLIRSDNPYVNCNYRLTQDSVRTFAPFLSKRLVKITAPGIVTLLSEEAPFFFKFTDSFAETVKEFSQGSMVLMYEPEGKDSKPNCKLVFIAWRGKTSLRSFVPRYERSHYLRLCGVELSENVPEEQAAKAVDAEGTPTSTEKKADTTESPEVIPPLEEEEVVPPPELEGDD